MRKLGRLAGMVGMVVLFAAAQAGAVDYTWTGGGAALWTDPVNWGGGGYPNGAGDTALINSGSTAITIPAGTTLGALALDTGYAGTVSLAGNLTLDDSGGRTGNLTVNAGTLQTGKDVASGIAADGTFSIGASGTVIVRRKNTTGYGAGQTLTAGTLTVAGNLNADGQGFNNSSGPGYGAVGDGGSHGGRGGDYLYNRTTGITYGSLTNPTELGSSPDANGLGGGAIIIVVSGGATVSGTVSADGTKGANNRGGAGGSVNITAAALVGSGTIRANGGDGGGTTGAGGGGRVAFAISGTDSFSGVIEAKGKDNGVRGQAGSIYLSQQKRNNLTLGGAGNMQTLRLGTDDTMGPSGSVNYTFGNVTIESGGVLEVDGNFSLNVVNGTVHGSAAVLQVATLDVKAGGIVRADAFGFLAGANGGPGVGGATADAGSYGGRGGDYASNNTTGPTYGSALNPAALGSGAFDTLGAGGGAIFIIASGTITNNGTISANGQSNTPNYRTGSGGSIKIVAPALAGTTGSVQARGGNSVGTYASGGGGRVAVFLSSVSSFDGVTIDAFGGTVGQKGAAGTVYLQHAADSTGAGLLRIDNPHVTATTRTVTELPSYVDRVANVNELTAATVLAANKGVIALTSNLTVGDLFLTGTVTPSLYLNGYTLTVNSLYHEDWGSESLVNSAGGQIVWKQPPGETILMVR